MSKTEKKIKKEPRHVSKWGGSLCPFGKFLQKIDIPRDTVAKLFKVSPAYISMLAHGKATPGLALALDIMRWTRKGAEKGEFDQEFGCEDWGL